MKSLLSFGHRCGYLMVNVGAAVRLPKVKSTLAERILEEGAVQQMLALERNDRDRALLRLLYLGGLRISEVCQLRARDLQPRDDTGQVTVFGKGGKSRAVLLKPFPAQDRLEGVCFTRSDGRQACCSRDTGGRRTRRPDHVAESISERAQNG